MHVLSPIFSLFALALPLAAQQSNNAFTPEIKTALAAKANGTSVQADNWMVVATNPLAVQSGARVLRAGRTAADAMVALQSVLGLVEPQSSGLGGGAFLVWYDGTTIEIKTLDGCETAPMAATPTLFQDSSGAPLKFFYAVVGGLPVGTPGTPALMVTAQKRWGKLAWPALFSEAVSLADIGFTVSPRLAVMVNYDQKRMNRFPSTAAYLLPDGKLVKAGDILHNPAYAASMRTLGGLGVTAPESWRLIGDASRLAFADRGRYMADSHFVPMPTKGLIDPAYLASRSALLEGDTALKEVTAGDPPFDHALSWSPDDSMELPSTSHIPIIDRYENALSMTTTIETAFGSRLITPGGYFLNNELTNFSFRTHHNGVPIANRLEPGKRPRSSMAPTIVLKDGKPVLVLGSPGSSRITGYVAKTIIAHLDWNLNIQAAVDLPHLINQFGTYDLETGEAAETMTKPLAKALKSLGFEVKCATSTLAYMQFRCPRAGCLVAQITGVKASRLANEFASPPLDVPLPILI